MKPKFALVLLCGTNVLYPLTGVERCVRCQRNVSSGSAMWALHAPFGWCALDELAMHAGGISLCLFATQPRKVLHLCCSIHTHPRKVLHFSFRFTHQPYYMAASLLSPFLLTSINRCISYFPLPSICLRCGISVSPFLSVCVNHCVFSPAFLSIRQRGLFTSLVVKCCGTCIYRFKPAVLTPFPFLQDGSFHSEKGENKTENGKSMCNS